MSLINKMLQDLETRQGGARRAGGGDKPIFYDLQPARRDTESKHIGVFVVFLALVGIGVAGFFVWERMARPGEPVAATPLEKAAPTVASLATDVASPALPTESVAATPVAAQPTSPAPAAVVQAKSAKPVESTPTAPQENERREAPRPQAVVRASAPPPPSPSAKTASGAAAPVDTDSRIEIKNVAPSPERIAEQAYRDAAQFLKQRQANKAEERLDAALAAYPRHTAARELLVGLMLEAGRSAEAREVLQQGMAHNPGYSGFPQLLARIYVEQGREPEALQVLNEVLKGDRHDADLLAFAATLQQRAGTHREAVGLYREALSLRPLEGKWWLGLGISEEANQNWAAARDAYTRARAANIESRLAEYAEQRLTALRAKQ